MSTATIRPVPIHPLTAGTTPAILWTAGELLGLARRVLAACFGFWATFHLLTDTLPVGPTLGGLVVIYGSLLVERSLHRDANFRTPGGLGSADRRAPRTRALQAAPGWASTAVGYLLTLVILRELLHTPAAAIPATAVTATWTVAQVFVFGLVPGVVALLALDTARATYRSITTRSWVPYGYPILTAGFTVGLIAIAWPLLSPQAADTTVDVAATVAALTLMVWAVVAFGLHRERTGPAGPSPDLAGIALTWWHGAPTLEDRRRYRPWINAALIAALVIVVIIVFTLTSLL